MRRGRFVVGAAMAAVLFVAVIAGAGAQGDPAAAVRAALAAAGQDPTGYEVRTSAEDGTWAVVAAWQSHVEPRPFFALARRSDGSWQAVLPRTGAAYNAWLDALPEALMDPATRDFLRQPGAGRLATYTGFCLPWTVGQRGTVTTSPAAEGHTNQIDYNVWVGERRYENGLLAADRMGTVRYFKDTGDTQCQWSASLGKWVYDETATACPWTEANLLVLEHPDGLFSWYLHLQHGSIPAALKSVGHPVHRGDVVATEGSTGWSTGPHLHFMVTTAYAVGSSGMPWSNTQVPVEFVNGDATLAYANMVKDATLERLPVRDTLVYLPGLFHRD